MTPDFTREQYGFDIQSKSQQVANTSHSITPIEESKSGNVLILSCSDEISSDSWIVDSGPRDHICSSLINFIHINMLNNNLFFLSPSEIKNFS